VRGDGRVGGGGGHGGEALRGSGLLAAGGVQGAEEVLQGAVAEVMGAAARPGARVGGSRVPAGTGHARAGRERATARPQPTSPASCRTAAWRPERSIATAAIASGGAGRVWQLRAARPVEPLPGVQRAPRLRRHARSGNGSPGLRASSFRGGSDAPMFAVREGLLDVQRGAAQGMVAMPANRKGKRCDAIGACRQRGGAWPPCAHGVPQRRRACQQDRVGAQQMRAPPGSRHPRGTR
jgi:hypothetical protein